MADGVRDEVDDDDAAAVATFFAVVGWAGAGSQGNVSGSAVVPVVSPFSFAGSWGIAVSAGAGAGAAAVAAEESVAASDAALASRSFFDFLAAANTT